MLIHTMVCNEMSTFSDTKSIQISYSQVTDTHLPLFASFFGV